MKKKISVLNLNKKYNGQIVLEDISFNINEGEFVSILGSSGCGKTTLLKILIGIEKSDTGIILKDDEDITNKKPSERGMGLVFQNYALFPNMSVWKNVAYALKSNVVSRPCPDKELLKSIDLEVIELEKKMSKFEKAYAKIEKLKASGKQDDQVAKLEQTYQRATYDELRNQLINLGLKREEVFLDECSSYKARYTKSEIKEIVNNVLNVVGLTDFANKKPGKLSGGQQQRVAIARTLALNPDIILFDEPMAALDADIRMSLRKEIKNIQKEFNKTMIYVTHDQEEAFSMSDRIIVMNDNHIAQFDTPNNIYKKPANEFVKRFVVDHLTEKAQAIIDSTK